MYFVISDIHSFDTQMQTALDSKGFDINNPNHKLIVCGDVFDRGLGTIDTYNFLKSIPADRLVLIRGNHEQLYLKLLEKQIPDKHDYSNGTVKTFCAIAGIDEWQMSPQYWYIQQQLTGTKVSVKQKLYTTWKKIIKKVKSSEITEWIKSDVWKNYYELDKYIFVHSFIPTKYVGDANDISEGYARYYSMTGLFGYDEDWRNASDEAWQDAAWGCPFKEFDAGFFDVEANKGKILVCGHYEARAFHQHYEYTEFKDEDDTIYYGKNLIAIDACTARSLFCNVLVINDDFSIK